MTIRQLDYQAIDGSWQELKPVSILNAYSLFAKYEQLVAHLNSLDKDTEIWLLYITDVYLAKLCNDCLELAGIQPSHCNAEMLISFLFPHIGADGELQDQGIIFSFNFPKKQTKSNKNSLVELNEILAALWASTEDLEQAYRLIGTMSIEELDAVLKYKQKLLQPEKVKSQKKGFDDAMQIMKEKGLIV